MSKLETNTIDNISGSSTLTIGDSNASTISIPKNITLGASGTTITVPSGATITNNGTQTGFGGTNTPAFRAYTDTIQTTSDNVITKAELDLETYDTDSCYDTSTYRFTPNVAGKYVFNFLATDNWTGSAATSVQIFIRKNGSDIAEYQNNSKGSNYGSNFISTTVDMNGTTDYVEFYLWYVGGSSVIWRNNSDRQYAEGYRLIT